MKKSIHLYRHTYAKYFIRNGGDVFRLQKLLGHSTLDMSRNYVELFTEDLKLNYNDTNPLERFCNKGNSISMR